MHDQYPVQNDVELHGLDSDMMTSERRKVTP
jgi:hypothetical protein